MKTYMSQLDSHTKQWDDGARSRAEVAEWDRMHNVPRLTLSQTLEVMNARPGVTEFTGEVVPVTASEHDAHEVNQLHRQRELEKDMKRGRFKGEGGSFRPMMWTADERRRLKQLDRGLDPVGELSMTKALKKAGIPVQKRLGTMSVGMTAMVEQALHMNAVKPKGNAQQRP